MSNLESIQATEWDNLYKEILSLLGKFGVDDYLCSKDYWVVDDNWGSVQQKIYVTNPSLFENEIFTHIQQLLQKYTLDWEVICVWTVSDKKRDDDVVVIKRDAIAIKNSAEG